MIVQLKKGGGVLIFGREWAYLEHEIQKMV